MPSNHLILCHPLLPPSAFPSIRVFSSESGLHIRRPKDWSFSFSISPSNEYSGLISFKTDWFDLCGLWFDPRDSQKSPHSLLLNYYILADRKNSKDYPTLQTSTNSISGSSKPKTCFLPNTSFPAAKHIFLLFSLNIWFLSMSHTLNYSLP